jgi:Peptidase MA superfamily
MDPPAQQLRRAGKKMKIKIFSIFILSLTLLFAIPDKQLTMDGVSVYFADKDEKIAEISLKIVHTQRERLIALYGLKVKPIHIHIADDQKTYNKYSGSNSPAWSVGLAGHDKMLVKSPSFSRQTLKNYQETLLHETVHLALEGIPLPVWFNEGLAQYEAGQFSLQKHIIVSRQYWQHNLMSYQKIEQLMQMPQATAEIAYAQSVAMVDFLVDYFSVGLVGKCLLYAGTYQDFEKGFQSAFLMSSQNFITLWQEEAKNQYRLYIFLDQNNIIWILAPIILILGFILTRLRRRKLLKKWEAAELEEDEVA